MNDHHFEIKRAGGRDFDVLFFANANPQGLRVAIATLKSNGEVFIAFQEPAVFWSPALLQDLIDIVKTINFDTYIEIASGEELDRIAGSRIRRTLADDAFREFIKRMT